jgi:hypothetical protein
MVIWRGKLILKIERGLTTMISNLQEFIEVGFGEEITLSLKSSSQIALLIAFLMLVLLPISALSATVHDFTGTVMKVSEPNGLNVRITELELQDLFDRSNPGTTPAQPVVFQGQGAAVRYRWA